MKCRRIWLGSALLLVSLLVWFLVASGFRNGNQVAEVTTPTKSKGFESNFKPLPKGEAGTKSSAAPDLGRETAVLEVEAPEIAPLMEEALERDRRKLPYRFAKPIDVSKPAASLASWKREGDRAVWELVVHSPGALSLNFAFDKVSIPPGGILSLKSLDDDYEVSFTSRDNEEHGELWTPIFKGDATRITASVPFQLLGDYSLALNKVNFGFRKIGGGGSGSCNVDVICGTGDVAFGALIEQYRDQIRAVGAYTLQGSDTCSGTLLNNTANDGTPYFLTADHCGINSSNDASMVIYWNYQNSTCRAPGGTASGLAGNGSAQTFNSGTIFRATFSTSDFCLVELDDPLNPNANAYFAGWDRSGATPSSTCGIHHPAVEEKRISFDYDPPTTTAAYSDSFSASGSHWRIADWDEGTTEGGSSGSGLFDQNGRLIGDLSGGDAACGNNDPDWYGRFFRSWTGGGTNASRLSNWLDPLGTAPSTLDGISQAPQLSIEDVAVNEGDSGTTEATITVSLGETSTQQITFDLVPAGGSATSGSDYVNPGTISLMIPAGQSQATATIDIIGDTTPEENESILLQLQNPSNAVIGDATATLVILNDDFIAPVFTGPATINGNAESSLNIQIAADNTPTDYAIANAPAGMTVDALSGLITWPAPIEGSYAINVTVSNEGGSDTGVVNVTIAGSLKRDALDVPPSVPVSFPDSRWTAQTAVTIDGEDALRVSGVGHSQSSSFTFEVQGPDEVAFWWKCSSEEGFDILTCRLDSTVIASVSGETEWALVTFPVPSGSHTVTVTYAKDSSVSSGLDSAWVDSVNVRSLSPPDFALSDIIRVPLGTPFAIELVTIFAPAGVSATTTNPNLFLNSDNHIQGLLTASGTFTATATNEVGTRSRVFELQPVASLTSLANAIDQPDAFCESITSTKWTTSATLGYTTNGSTSIRSGPISDDGLTTCSLLVPGPGTMQFDWRVSSESGYDFGSYVFNGAVVDEISGSSSWTSQQVTLQPGMNVITWRYRKDGSASSGLDGLFVDNVRFTGYAKWVADHGLNVFSCPPFSGTDGDRNQALLEYAVGLSPTVREAAHVPAITGSPGALTVSSARDATATDITLTLQKSNDLATDGWTNLVTGSGPSGVSASDNSGDAASFFRLSVTSP